MTDARKTSLAHWPKVSEAVFVPFELPEAQLDRFMLLHRLGCREDEQMNLQRQLGMGLRREGAGAVPRSAFDMIEDNASASVEDLVVAMEAVQAVHVSQVFVKHCVELVRRTRESRLLDFGCSPRAGLPLINASRARAVIHDRDYVTPEDLFDLAEERGAAPDPRQLRSLRRLAHRRAGAGVDPRESWLGLRHEMILPTSI